jgi:pyruvate formate lyase activating enzyme
MDSGQTRGLIFDIQGHSVHDGPGGRTLVFLSGCALRCAWCSNPEGQLRRQRLMFKARLCRNCPFRCVEACLKGAVQRSQHNGLPVTFDRKLCDSCDTMDCVKVCYTQALQPSGRWYTVDELMHVLHRDRFYWGPQGGVSLGGGEPLLQRDFVLNVLERCHDAYISVCLETSAYVPREVLEAAVPHVQWLFIDIKHMDSARHAAGTGVTNELILDNIRWLKSSAWPGRVVIRMAVIPGFNDTMENAQATAEFMNQTGLKEMNLLPFHRLGASKYEQLGICYGYAEQAAMSPESLEPITAVFRGKGITCYLGPDTPF